MRALSALGAAIEAANALIGRAAVWLLLAAVLLSAGNAVMRKAFSLSSNAMLEAQWYLIGTLVMLAAPWVLQCNAHVRIELLSSRFSARGRKLVELFGHLLMLLPFTGLLFWMSLPFFLRSYRQGEMSLNAGGLPVWPMRGMVMLGFALLTLQALASIIRLLREWQDPAEGGDAGALAR